MPARKKSTTNGSAASPAPDTAVAATAALDTRIVEVDPKSLSILETNARYMDNAMFEQLVANVRKDGRLTSLPTVALAGKHPLIAGSKPDTLEVLSGNHRVQAAVKAGLETIQAIEVTPPLTRERKIAIQLSHNAISGKDDPNILKQLYSGLDLSMKAYSGLTDDAFGDLAELDSASLSIGTPQYEEITLAFLPEQKQEFLDLVERVAGDDDAATHLVAHYDDFGRLFDAIVTVKTKLDIHNTAVAMRVMAELAVARLEELQGGDDGES